MCRSNTGSTMLYWLVRDTELSQIMPNHLRLDFNLVKCLPIVNTNNASNHFRNNNHVTQMSLDTSRFLHGGCIFLGFSQTLHECHWLALESSRESSPCTTWKQLHQLLIVHVQKLIQVNSTVCVLAKCSLLFLFSGISQICVRHFTITTTLQTPKEQYINTVQMALQKWHLLLLFLVHSQLFMGLQDISQIWELYKKFVQTCLLWNCGCCSWCYDFEWGWNLWYFLEKANIIIMHCDFIF